MTDRKMNRKLLQHWVTYKLAVADTGNGEWGWTDKATKKYNNIVRRLLGDILIGFRCPADARPILEEAGFDPYSGELKKQA